MKISQLNFILKAEEKVQDITYKTRKILKASQKAQKRYEKLIQKDAIDLTEAEAIFIDKYETAQADLERANLSIILTSLEAVEKACAELTADID